MLYRTSCLTLALISLAGGCSIAPDNSSSIPQSIAAAERAQWQQFAPDPKEFSLLMPGVPIATQSEGGTDKTVVKEGSFVLKARQGNYKAAYMISYADYAPEQRGVLSDEKIVDSTWQAAYGDIGNKMVYKKKIKYQGFEGVEFQYTGGKNASHLVTSRNYLVKNRLYQISAIMSKEQFDRGDAMKYLDSFKLSS